MAYKIKSGKRGRPQNSLKIRNLSAIAPQGFVLYKVSAKNKQAIYKKVE